LSEYGKRPRVGENQKTRLMVLRSELQADRRAPADDRRLLNLLIVVADLLPIEQRHQLRAAL
jgi:hypothetical protein